MERCAAGVFAARAPPFAVGEQACMRPLPFHERGWPAVSVRPFSGCVRKRQWNSDTIEQEHSENVLAGRFRQRIRAPRARFTPSGLKFLRDGLPTAADHEIVPFSAISAPFGLKLGGSSALVQPQAAGDGGGEPCALAYSAVPRRPRVCVGQPHLLLVQQRAEGARICHGGERWTYFPAAGEWRGRRGEASGVVAVREGVWVVTKSAVEPSEGVCSGPPLNGKCPSPRVRRTL